MAFDLQAPVKSHKYIALSETVNRMHDVALGARFSINDEGIVEVVTDILDCTVDNDVVATVCTQLLFLSEKIAVAIQEIASGGVSLTSEEIDALFS